MPTDVPISHWISKLGSLQPVSGAGGGDTGYRPLDEGEIAAATLIAYGAAAIPEIIKTVNSDNWIVRCRCVEVMGILGLDRDVGRHTIEAVLPALVVLMSDRNLNVQQSAMLALLGDSAEKVTESKRLSSISDFVEFCHSASRFDLLDLLVRCGTKEVRNHAERLLKQLLKQRGPLARRIVLDNSSSYAEKKQNLEVLKIDTERSIRWLCEEIKKTGTEQESISADQFVQNWINVSQLGRAGSAPPTPSEQLVRPVLFNPTPNASQELGRSSDKPERGAAPPVPSAPKKQPKKNWLSLVTLPNLFGGGRLQRVPLVPPVPFTQTPPVPSVEEYATRTTPVPSVEEYATRTHGRRCVATVAGMTMILIPAGDFLMGDADQSSNPRRTVSLDAYWISEHPVTVKQYFQFCSETDHAKPKEPGWGWRDEDPVVNVGWNDAQDYCKWASQKGVPIRLPMEQEWEKAARGPSGLKYPWGNEWDGNKCVNRAKRTESVHSHPEGASPYGVMHMSGNVWEWCADWYDTNHNSRVMRGGSWVSYDSDYFRASYRYWNYPDSRYDLNGFRAVAAPSPPKSPSDLTRKRPR